MRGNIARNGKRDGEWRKQGGKLEVGRKAACLHAGADGAVDEVGDPADAVGELLQVLAAQQAGRDLAQARQVLEEEHGRLRGKKKGFREWVWELG